MRGPIGTSLLLACTLFISMGPGAMVESASADALGGDPIHTDVDFMSVTAELPTWGVRVSSFVYGRESAVVPPGMPPPGENQLLFVYLLENTGTGRPATDHSVTLFVVGNADYVPIAEPGPILQGAIPVPAGLSLNHYYYARDMFDNGVNYASYYEYRNDPPPQTFQLEVGKWSIMYVLANSPCWRDQNGTVSGSTADSKPVPAPGADVCRPVVVQPPQGAAVNVGGFAQLSVAVAGTGPFNYRWRKDEIELADDARISGSAASTLTIGPAELFDAGSYDVVIANEFGSVASDPAVLAVHAVPTTLMEARSVVEHMMGGDVRQEFYLPLDISGNAATRTNEPRDAGLRILDFVFKEPVEWATVSVDYDVPRSMTLFDGGLRGRATLSSALPNAAVYTLTVQASTGPGGDLNQSMCVAALIGDFNGDGAVNAADKAELLGFVFQPINQSNAKYDLQVNGGNSGVIDVADVAAWTGFFGAAVAAAPCP